MQPPPFILCQQLFHALRHQLCKEAVAPAVHIVNPCVHLILCASVSVAASCSAGNVCNPPTPVLHTQPSHHHMAQSSSKGRSCVQCIHHRTAAVVTDTCWLRVRHQFRHQQMADLVALPLAVRQARARVIMTSWQLPKHSTTPPTW